MSFILNDWTPSTWEACLGIGTQTSAVNSKSKIRSEEYLDSFISQDKSIPMADVTMCNLSFILGGDTIPLSTCFGFEWVLDLDNDGLIGRSPICPRFQMTVDTTSMIPSRLRIGFAKSLSTVKRSVSIATSRVEGWRGRILFLTPACVRVRI
ncbi:MAG: hypothetical protein GY854_23045 [Deltaproteobacteria bacterium]|nr:hypothetical protein [Deltaproteobacteria bacterium]